MNFILNLLLITTATFSLITRANSQSITIDYVERRLDKSNNNKLLIYDSISIWRKTSKDDTNSSLNDMFVVKDKASGVIKYNDILFGKELFVQDSLYTMKWELVEDSMTYLGNVCYSAKIAFRGRKYKALYTMALPLSDGPWKFNGLPGLILKVESLDGDYEWTASLITINPTSETTKIEWQEKKYLSWQSFQLIFIETVDKIVKKVKSTVSGDENGYIKINSPEIIYPIVQSGNGIEY